MKAVIYEKYGSPDVLKIAEVDKPTPQANDVLIRVCATTVTIGDSRMRSFTVPRWQWVMARLYLGVLKPRRAILGMELSGVIEAVGQDVTRFAVGDAVFASTFDVDFGGYAEYKCIPEDSLIAHKPDNLTFEEAAAVVGGGMTALRCLSQANIQQGQDVLIYGASGAVGTNAVQLAKHYYGANVTGVCSTKNFDMVTALGADAVIDYTKEDIGQSSQRYDVVFDAVAKYPTDKAKSILKPNGVYLNAHKDSNSNGQQRKDVFDQVAKLASDGTLMPFIDRSYSLEQIVEAHEYVDTGRKRGNVAITI